MSQWINVCKTEQLTPGSWQIVHTDFVSIVVFNVEGQYYAIADICTHDGGTLSDGEVENCEIICPRHGARFDVRTGEVKAPPAYEDVPTYPVRVENGMVQVGIGGP